jgi:hypothetical protein
VFVGDDLPELGADLVAALAALDVYEFAHVASGSWDCELGQTGRFNAKFTRLTEIESQSPLVYRGGEGTLLRPAIHSGLPR